ncbi:MAG: magnesium/cobalt transporter CorA [Phycisphaerae bacterium]|jgi:magnesium transporter
MVKTNKTSQKAGLAPGTLLHIGEKRSGSTELDMFRYGTDIFERHTNIKLDEALDGIKGHANTWLNITGLEDISVIQKIGDAFGLHQLILEDIVNTAQRPKFEQYSGNIYVVMRMLHYDTLTGELDNEQVSLILGEGYVLSFQEIDGDVFGRIRERLTNPESRLRRSQADYLLYTLIDAIVDSCFTVLESIDEKIDAIEDALMEDDEDASTEIYSLKRTLLQVKKAIWPAKELLSDMAREESELIGESIAPYMRDVADHVRQIIDAVDSHREACHSLQEMHSTYISNRMNEVMKVLTIIATIFIPLTFIAGVYGMNFKYMPELDRKWAYPCIWGVMLSLALWMLYIFHKKKWL